MTEVLYELCPGHSGSTLLDLILGSMRDVFSCGEVTYMPWQFYRGREHPNVVSPEQARSSQSVCTCLHSFPDCPVWGKVVVGLSAKVGFDILADPLRFRIALLRSPRYRRGLGYRLLSRLRYSLSRYVCRRRPGSLASRWFYRRWQQVIDNNWLMFDEIHAVTKSRWIVDSTKDIVRAALLHQHRPRETRFVVLLRDPRGFVCSCIRRGHDAGRLIRTWIAYYRRLVETLEALDGAEWVAVQYDWLTVRTVAVRRYLADFLGVEDPGTDVRIDTADSHMIAGNPMRYGGKIEIHEDTRWKTELEPELASQAAQAMHLLPDTLRTRLAQAKAQVIVTDGNPSGLGQDA